MITIPVRNIWLLQLLASDFQTRGDYSMSGSESIPEHIPSFVSTILADEVSARLNTGLTTGFNRTEQTVRRVRGKIDILTTARFNLLAQGRIHCQFDQIDHDILSNRLVLAALRRATRLPGTDARCRRLADELARTGISATEPTRRERRELRRSRALARDRRMISVAELMLDLAIPEPGAGVHDVVSPRDNATYLRTLFEKAVGGFYKHIVGPRGWEVVTGKWLAWQEEDSTSGMRSILPGMQTDIILRPPDSAPMIIDTKFTDVTRANQYQQQKLKSEYLYQIYTYVRTQEYNPQFGPDTVGILLHPVVDGSVREVTRIGTHVFGVATVDLSADYSTIYRDLLQAAHLADAEFSNEERGIVSDSTAG